MKDLETEAVEKRLFALWHAVRDMVVDLRTPAVREAFEASLLRRNVASDLMLDEVTELNRMFSEVLGQAPGNTRK